MTIVYYPNYTVVNKSKITFNATRNVLVRIHDLNIINKCTLILKKKTQQQSQHFSLHNVDE